MQYDVIIIGGSYSGIAAALSLGRAMQRVLVIDSGKPCNRYTKRSHNFITHDGEEPTHIAAIAKEEVLQYPTVEFYEGLAVKAAKNTDGLFDVITASDDLFSAKKLLFTTGIIDCMPAIKGFDECWGISTLHCPYCHGYEFKDKIIGVIGNSDLGYELCKIHSNWSKRVIVFTQGKPSFTKGQQDKLDDFNATIIEDEIAEIIHEDGYLTRVLLSNAQEVELNALYAKIEFKQHCEIPQQLGCGIDENGYIAVDAYHKTTVDGVFAAGDNSTQFRSIAAAVASGNKAGIFIHKELAEEGF